MRTIAIQRRKRIALSIKGNLIQITRRLVARKSPRLMRSRSKRGLQRNSLRGRCMNMKIASINMKRESLNKEKIRSASTNSMIVSLNHARTKPGSKSSSLVTLNKSLDRCPTSSALPRVLMIKTDFHNQKNIQIRVS